MISIIFVVCVLVIVAAVYMVMASYLINFAIARKIKPKLEKMQIMEGKPDPCRDMAKEARKNFEDYDMEEVNIVSREGLKLYGRYFPTDTPSDKVMICFHGYRGNAENDFGGTSKFYHKNGYNLLFVDQRAMNKSEGKYIGMGVLERYDCLKWVEYINDRFQNNVKIYLAGVSMGTSTILMATELNLPKNVKGIIADCGFTSPYEEFEHCIKNLMKKQRFPLLPMSDILCRLQAGYGFRSASATEAMKTNKIPVLFIHGGADEFVPTDMSRINCAACATKKKLIIIDGAEHGMSYYKDTKKYEKAVTEFLSEI